MSKLRDENTDSAYVLKLLNTYAMLIKFLIFYVNILSFYVNKVFKVIKHICYVNKENS